mgnify:CR=1 FL=1
MKTKLINVGLLLGTISLFVLLLEVFFRVTHLMGARPSWSTPDPMIGFRFVPNHSYWHFNENDHPISGNINNFGWRDHDWTLEKPDGVYRVALLGDSFIEALQVELDSTFFQIAERSLNALSGKKIEFMNFGRSGFTQSEQLIVLKEDVLQFSPDLVMLFFLPGNDVSDINKQTASDQLRPFYSIDGENRLVLNTDFSESREYKMKALLSPIKEKSALASLIAERYTMMRAVQRAEEINTEPADEKRISGVLSLCTNRPDSIYFQNYLLNKRLIEEINRTCVQNDVEFVLVGINSVYHKDEIVDHQAIDPSFKPGFFDDDLRHFSAVQGFDFVGLQKPFVGYYARTGKSLNWGHWNYQGHRLVAEVLSKYLSQKLMQAPALAN